MSEELATHQLMRHQEFLWGIRVEHENYAIKSAGGHLILLNVPDAVVGSVVSHTGAGNGAVGNKGALYTTGSVVAKHADGRSYVTIAGIAPVSSEIAASLGSRVYADSGKQTTPSGDTDQNTFIGTVIGENEDQEPIMALNAGRSVPMTPPTVTGMLKGSVHPLACVACRIACTPTTATIISHGHGVKNAEISGNKVAITLCSGTLCANGCVHTGIEGAGTVSSAKFHSDTSLVVTLGAPVTAELILHVICFVSRKGDA